MRQVLHRAPVPGIDLIVPGRVGIQPGGGDNHLWIVDRPDLADEVIAALDLSILFGRRRAGQVAANCVVQVTRADTPARIEHHEWAVVTGGAYCTDLPVLESHE